MWDVFRIYENFENTHRNSGGPSSSSPSFFFFFIILSFVVWDLSHSTQKKTGKNPKFKKRKPRQGDRSDTEMSSDDDLDEDELLQMALKEQSQRDLNYHQRPHSNNSRKPVANYVQPPPQPRKASAAPAAAAAAASPARNNLHAKKPSQGSSRRTADDDDDDDDSEVEMLSISSGDEDSTSKEHRRGASVGGPRGRAGRVGRDDDSVWDGEEPDCWKRVDEAEVWLFWIFFLLILFFFVWISLVFLNQFFTKMEVWHAIRLSNLLFGVILW